MGPSLPLKDIYEGMGRGWDAYFCVKFLVLKDS